MHYSGRPKIIGQDPPLIVGMGMRTGTRQICTSASLYLIEKFGYFPYLINARISC